MPLRQNVTLEDKYKLDQDEVLMTGIQALVRLALEQKRRDRALGLNTAGFISGYRGSPLGGFDQELWRQKKFLSSHDIVFEPGVNEDLGATAVWGSQQTNLFPGARFDGVFGFWYGKAPGVDRTMDVFRHANAAGSMPKGGVVAICGDDHDCKSSTLPSQSEQAMIHAEIPVLNPATNQDVLDYGLMGIALSRYSGCWVALIALADTMDSSGIVNIDPARLAIHTPEDFQLPPGGVHIRLGDTPLAQEERMRNWKLPAALAFARANSLNRIVVDSPAPKLGLFATGKAYLDLRQALDILGIDERKAAELGLRIVKIGMSWPLDPATMQDFTRGLDTVLVIEAKRNLIEDQLKAILYQLPDSQRPQIIGKHDEQGAPLLPEIKSVEAADIARILAARLPPGAISSGSRRYLEAVAAKASLLSTMPAKTDRIAFYCSGCPHNTSTKVIEGSRAMAGIGCHYMVTWMDRSSHLFSQMGGEGLHWVGQAPFTTEKHVFVNLGDGTYFHSGLLAIRAAVAARVNATYKILFNDAVAMTGGQPVDGVLSPQLIARQVLAEGVAGVTIVSDDIEKYNDQPPFPSGVPIEHRGQMQAVEKAMRDKPGVTVLIYDQTCAAEKRRRRKRGKMADPAKRLYINDAVCEGCGDCSTASNCLSVEPLETELGRKRRINQSSCNKDYSCLNGFCPSFVTVLGGGLRTTASGVEISDDPALPEPAITALERPYNIVVTGIGGTGITTVSALLAAAAYIEGMGGAALDMNGLAQKGGAVMSHIRLAATPAQLYGARIAEGEADLLLAADMVVAAGKEAQRLYRSERTQIVANAKLVPTASFVKNRDVQYDTDGMLAALQQSGAGFAEIDAITMAERALGDSLYANVLLLGFAWQRGLVPISRAALFQAIELNGTAVAANKKAFTLGRMLADRPELAAEIAGPNDEAPKPLTLPELVARRKELLTQYQSKSYAKRYEKLIMAVFKAEEALMPGQENLSRAVAENYYKLLAYKDEYEVARLYSAPEFKAKLDQQFAGDYQLELNLAPPLLARRDPTTGKPQKQAFGPWIFPVMRLLAKGKVLRGTPFDIFGYTEERKMERRLIKDYVEMIQSLLPRLTPATYPVALELARLPEQIRGFGHIKAASVVEAERRKAGLLIRFDAGNPTQERRAA